jgi:hypothetical protein
MITQDEITYLKNAGRMNKNLVHVKTHALDIPDRIEAIDPRCFVMFNPDTQKYEIHNKNYDFTLMLTLPYMVLDIRAAIVLLNSMKKTPRQVEKEIDEHNEKIEKASEDAVKDEVKCKTGEVYKYVKAHESKEAPDAGAFSTRFV